MRRVAEILSIMAVAASLSACGGQREAGWSQAATGADDFQLRTGTESLPEGHPPLDGYGRALPHGHPPVPGYSPGLPEGHPVCPAGRDRPESLPQGTWDGQGGAQGLIST
jgi:hypothetical protein